MRDLVLNYLGVAIQSDQKDSINIQQHSQINQNIAVQRQFSNVQSSHGRVYEDFSKDLEMQRTDSFLPSNTGTGNRSQLSHISIESLSQLYNQNLRLKFGSAPAQLLTIGREAELSLEKRASAIKKQFQIGNDVSTRSQVSQNMSKQAMHGGTISSGSWIKKEDPSIVTIETSGTGAGVGRVAGSENRQKMSHQVSSNANKMILYNGETEDSDEEEDNLVMTNKNNKTVSRYSSGRFSNMTSPRSIQLK